MNDQIISSYSRQQAIEDGVLVQLSGPGYGGDDWVPQMVSETGIKMPLSMTVEAFRRCVTPIEGEGGEQLAPCQDAKGRLWDVLTMLRVRIRLVGNESQLLFQVYIVPNIPTGSKRHPRAKKTTLKCVCGPNDDLSPCLTIMLPEED